MTSFEIKINSPKNEDLNKQSSNVSINSVTNTFLKLKNEFSTFEIINFINNDLMKKIEKNKKLKIKQSRGPNEPFFSKKIPKLTLEKFLYRVIKYTEIENMTILLAFIYINKLIQKENFIIGINNVYRLLIGAVVLAIKILEDNKFDNEAYSQIGCLSLTEFNEIEYCLATRLNFELNPNYEDLENIIKQVNFYLSTQKSRNQSEDETTNSLTGSQLE